MVKNSELGNLNRQIAIKSGVNQILKYICYSLILISILYAAISVYSYLSVYLTFGKVPSSEDFTAEIIGTSGKSFHIFPSKLGIWVLEAYILSLLITVTFIPILIVALRSLKHSVKFRTPLIWAVSLNALIIILSYSTNFFFWYYSYILD